MTRWDWTGLRERRWTKHPDEEIRPAKTLWDVIQVAVIPVALVVLALLFNASEAARDRERDEKRARSDAENALDARRDDALRDYLDRMSALMLERRLLKSREGSSVRAVASSQTLTTLRRLDGARKGEVVRFLAEAGLLARPVSRLAVSKVDLTDAARTSRTSSTAGRARPRCRARASQVPASWAPRPKA